jgi:NAD(P) transhydrogenase subunit alpha
MVDQATAAKADLVVRIQPLTPDESQALKSGAVLFGMYQPLVNPDRMRAIADQGISLISMDAIPRITRAQSMDVLSSQASLAGYQAVLRAATLLPRIFPMMMTAAGTIAPAKVLVIGAGVAGLQAIATAKRLGAVVEAFDTRPSVKEQVESLGGKFVEVPGAVEDKGAGGYAVEQSAEYKQKQSEELEKRIVAADVVITTALIPGRKAPVLITASMVERMRAGSVIIDMAAAAGGNCELTQNNAVCTVHEVQIVGNGNLPAEKPQDASRMYAKNMLNFLTPCIKEGAFSLNFEDEIIKGSVITHGGAVVWGPLNKA